MKTPSSQPAFMADAVVVAGVADGGGDVVAGSGDAVTVTAGAVAPEHPASAMEITGTSAYRILMRLISRYRTTYARR